MDINGFQFYKAGGDILAGKEVSSVGKIAKGNIDQVAAEFESMFLAQMMQKIFENVPAGDELFGESFASDSFNSMLVDEYGKKIAESGGIGISDKIRESLLKKQYI